MFVRQGLGLMMLGTASSVMWPGVLLVRLEIMLFVRDVLQGFT